MAEAKERKKRAFMCVATKDYLFALGTLLTNLDSLKVDYDEMLVYSDEKLDFEEEQKLRKYKVRWIVYTIEDLKRELELDNLNENKWLIRRYSYFVLIKIFVFKHLEEFDSVVFLDLDILIKDDITELFNLECDIAWRNGYKLLHKINTGLTYKDVPCLQGIEMTFDVRSPNGGLIIVNRKFDYVKAYCDAKRIEREMLPHCFSMLDEIAIGLVTYKMKLNLLELEGTLYNTLPCMYLFNPRAYNSRLIHFFGMKPWNDPQKQYLFPEWMVNYEKNIRTLGFADSKITNFKRKGNSRIATFHNTCIYIKCVKQNTMKLLHHFPNSGDLKHGKVYVRFNRDETAGFLFFYVDRNIQYITKVNADGTVRISPYPEMFRIEKVSNGGYIRQSGLYLSARKNGKVSLMPRGLDWEIFEFIEDSSMGEKDEM